MVSVLHTFSNMRYYVTVRLSEMKDLNISLFVSNVQSCETINLQISFKGVLKYDPSQSVHVLMEICESISYFSYT